MYWVQCNTKQYVKVDREERLKFVSLLKSGRAARGRKRILI